MLCQSVIKPTSRLFSWSIAHLCTVTFKGNARGRGTSQASNTGMGSLGSNTGMGSFGDVGGNTGMGSFGGKSSRQPAAAVRRVRVFAVRVCGAVAVRECSAGVAVDAPLAAGAAAQVGRRRPWQRHRQVRGLLPALQPPRGRHISSLEQHQDVLQSMAREFLSRMAFCRCLCRLMNAPR